MARFRNGSALIAVLWVLVLVSLLAMSLTDRTQLEIELLRRQKVRAQAGALAEAGAIAALHYLGGGGRLPDPAPGQTAMRLSQAGDAVEFPFAEGSARVMLVNADCQANVNRLDAGNLAGILQWLDLSQPESEALAAAIADWIDADDLVRPGGAEAADYGPGEGPPNGPVVEMAGLEGVRGMTPALLWGENPFQEDGKRLGLADLLSTRGESKKACIDPATADLRLLVGGLGLDPSQAERLMEDREAMRSLPPSLSRTALQLLGDRVGAQKMLEIKDRLPTGRSDGLFVVSTGQPKMEGPSGTKAVVRVRILRWTHANTGMKHMDTLEWEYL